MGWRVEVLEVKAAAEGPAGAGGKMNAAVSNQSLASTVQPHVQANLTFFP